MSILDINPAQFDPRVKVGGVVNGRQISFTMMADADTVAYADDPYELDVVRLMAHYVEPGDTVIDAGANIGTHALALASLVGPSGTVIAIEPDPNNLRRLRRNRDQNQFQPGQIKIYEEFLWDKKEYVPFYSLNDENKGGYSSFIEYLPDAAGADVSNTKLMMLATTLDELLPDVTPRFLKIDCEGAEDRILHGAEKMLRRGIDCVVVEFNPPIFKALETTGRSIRDYMHGLGYDLFIPGRDLILPLHVPNDVDVKFKSQINVMFARVDGLAKAWRDLEI